jgi:hypothetical protein
LVSGRPSEGTGSPGHFPPTVLDVNYPGPVIHDVQPYADRHRSFYQRATANVRAELLNA